MTLTRAELTPIRHPPTDGVAFVMLDDVVKVRCVVPIEALNSLGRDCLTHTDKILRFAKHRTLIESVARRLYHQNALGNDVVVTETALRVTPMR